MSHLSDVQRQRLKAAIREQVSLSGGPEAAARICRIGAARLSGYGSLSEPDRYMPVDVAVDLARESGSAPVLDVMAALLGCVLIPVRGAGKDPLDRDMAVFGREVAAVFGAYAEARSDLRIDRREAEDIIRRLDGVIHAAAAARADLAEICERGPHGLRLGAAAEAE